jgi:hypothetical protein
MVSLGIPQATSGMQFRMIGGITKKNLIHNELCKRAWDADDAKQNSRA